VGALASVAADVTGIETDGGTAPAGGAVPGKAGVAPATCGPAAARFVEEGGVAGVSPATATACGEDCDDGSVGFAERATADESSGFARSFFHQATREPVAQPVAAINTASSVSDGSDVRFILDGSPRPFGERLASAPTLAKRFDRGAAFD
jgi:hypothetical protein